MLLAIDTSAGTSVAVVSPDASVVAEREVVDTRRHAELIGPLLTETLATAEVTAADITAVALGVGPGPFTGLRVGMAAGRVFAAARGIPVLPVVSLDAAALTLLTDGRPAPLVVVADARRRERYWARYTSLDDAGLPVRDGAPALSAPDAVPHPHEQAPVSTVSAGALGVVAALRRRHGRPQDDPEALYLRAPDVTPSTGSKRVTA